MSVLLMVDFAIGVLVVEALVLVLARRPTARWVLVRRHGANLAAGLFLLLAVRSAARGESLAVTGACLAIAGVAHVVDLRGRLAGR